MFVFTVLLIGVVGSLFLTLDEAAFERIGFSSGEFVLIIAGTLVGSAIVLAALF